ncbi:hypothetical protein ACO22_01113 [Paracoccidioides brasiliensis]|uniref:Uncharacterized protein n=1 Tax=Paracoccidioides brasiliensis TaxID=121759 RepID=A0A1D2JML9_PARBR|nr:hypothetical protein ACO22_01113 [Paracoccidioides brasiliensis]ODH52768.1 hypothetical protein GX48_00962 [Paracoccidioides brasiliensis]
MALKTCVPVVSHLQNAPGGFKHVGEDGILRSFDGNGNVVDYTQHSRHQLSVLICWALSWASSETIYLRNRRWPGKSR